MFLIRESLRVVGLIRIMTPLCTGQAQRGEAGEPGSAWLSAGGDLIQVTVIRRADGNVVTAGIHSRVHAATGACWREAAIRSINVLIVCNWQEYLAR